MINYSFISTVVIFWNHSGKRPESFKFWCQVNVAFVSRVCVCTSPIALYFFCPSFSPCDRMLVCPVRKLASLAFAQSICQVHLLLYKIPWDHVFHDGLFFNFLFLLLLIMYVVFVLDLVVAKHPVFSVIKDRCLNTCVNRVSRDSCS